MKTTAEIKSYIFSTLLDRGYSNNDLILFAPMLAEYDDLESLKQIKMFCDISDQKNFNSFIALHRELSQIEPINPSFIKYARSMVSHCFVFSDESIALSKEQIAYISYSYERLALYQNCEDEEDYFHCSEGIWDYIFMCSLYSKLQVRDMDSYLVSLKQDEVISFKDLTFHMFQRVKLPTIFQKHIEEHGMTELDKIIQLLLGRKMSDLDGLLLPLEKIDLQYLDTYYEFLGLDHRFISHYVLIAKLRHISDSISLIEKFLSKLRYSVNLFDSYIEILELYRIGVKINFIKPIIEVSRIVDFFIYSVKRDLFVEQYSEMNIDQIVERIQLWDESNKMMGLGWSELFG
tara:strand:- start:24 stop:1064 length:1041 start_codon:yes stop_codon:yes gene_type:complete